MGTGHETITEQKQIGGFDHQLEQMIFVLAIEVLTNTCALLFSLCSMPLAVSHRCFIAYCQSNQRSHQRDFQLGTRAQRSG